MTLKAIFFALFIVVGVSSFGQSSYTIQTYGSIDLNREITQPEASNWQPSIEYDQGWSSGVLLSSPLKEQCHFQIGMGYSYKNFNPHRHQSVIVWSQFPALETYVLSQQTFDIVEIPVGFAYDFFKTEIFTLSSSLQAIPSFITQQREMYGYFNPVSSFIDPATGLSSTELEYYSRSTFQMYNVKLWATTEFIINIKNHGVGLMMGFSPLEYRFENKSIHTNQLYERFTNFENQWLGIGQLSLGLVYRYTIASF